MVVFFFPLTANFTIGWLKLQKISIQLLGLTGNILNGMNWKKNKIKNCGLKILNFTEIAKTSAVFYNDRKLNNLKFSTNKLDKFIN